MGEHCGFGVAGAAAGELEVCNVVWTYYPVKDVKNVLGYRLCFVDEFVVMDEVLVFASYETDCLEVWQFF